jgi:putative spermidine/putrescine transport system ATP-binding protein
MSEALFATRKVPVRAEDIRHSFGEFVALKGVSLDVAPGQFVSLLGPSGSGKTTLLRIIAGLLMPRSGRVFIDGRDVTRLPADKRKIGFVFQNYALFPHLNVFENVAFALRLRRVPSDQVRQRVGAALEKVFLHGLDQRFPAELSGGQQQRVALARAIVFDPMVLLMDEPLGSLDKRLRQQLQLELRRLQREVGITTIYVTHDQEEAFTMSDRIAVMGQGELHQVGAPEEVYRQPSDDFVANFVGDLNYFEGELGSGGNGHAVLRIESGLTIRIAESGSARSGAKLGCGIRPERLQVGNDFEGDNRYAARIRTLTFRGSHYWADLVLSSGDALIAMLPSDCSLNEGDEVVVGWDVAAVRLFPTRDTRGAVNTDT